jgi:hypothetical protein
MGSSISTAVSSPAVPERNQTGARTFYIDILKAWVVLMIFIKHSGQPLTWYSVENFDLSLLFFLSGLLFSLSNGNKPIPMKDYFSKRVWRIVLPAWLGLAPFFLMTFWVPLWLGLPSEFTPRKLLGIYTFHTDWFTWVFRVFLMLALIAPGIQWLRLRLRPPSLLLIGLALYALLEGARLVIPSGLPGPLHWLWARLGEVIPYGWVYLLGATFLDLSARSRIALGIGHLAAWTLMALLITWRTGEFISTQEAKFPPLPYYTFYGVGVSLLLTQWAQGVDWQAWLRRPLVHRLISTLSRNCLEVYIAHIYCLYVINAIITGTDEWLFIPKALLVGAGSIGLVWAWQAFTTRTRPKAVAKPFRQVRLPS